MESLFTTYPFIFSLQCDGTATSQIQALQPLFHASMSLHHSDTCPLSNKGQHAPKKSLKDLKITICYCKQHLYSAHPTLSDKALIKLPVMQVFYVGVEVQCLVKGH